MAAKVKESISGIQLCTQILGSDLVITPLQEIGSRIIEPDLFSFPEVFYVIPIKVL